MSKIEKALKQARQQGAMTVVAKEGKKTQSSASATVSSTDLGSKTPASEAKDLVSRATASASIRRMQEHSLLEQEALLNRGIISPDTNDADVVRAFRELRTKIIQQTQGRNAIILVTSVAGDSGGSFVATNLAVAFAFDAGRTALLIDCNLRRPSMHHLLSNPDSLGITDYLENQAADVADIIHPVGIERLRLIPAGSRHDIPAEYFTSQRVRQLLDGIRNRYAERVVILDSPPMTESADTQILVDLCDYVLLVAPYGRVTHMQIENSIKSLDAQKLLGVVFNNQPRMPRLNVKELVQRTRQRVWQGFVNWRHWVARVPEMFGKRGMR